MKLRHTLFFLYSIMFFISPPGYAQPSGHDSPYKVSLDSEGSPKLVVGIVVDQMRYEYIPRFWNKFGEGGFRRLVNKGYNFSNNHFNYVPTATGPGHAAVYSGTTPSVNGIVANHWYDRNTKKGMYVVSDSTAQTVGTSGEAGQRSPRNLLSTTVTDELKTSKTDSKVIGISIKDRASILPAGHLADGAYWYDSDSGKFITSDWYADKLPQWINNFNNRKLPGEYSKKVWNPLLPLEQYTESDADDTPYERTFSGEKAPVFPHKMNGSLSRILVAPFGNTLVRKLAETAVDAEQLGNDKVTDLLAVSFSSTDKVGHHFGPRSIEVEDIYLRLDKELAHFLSFLDKKVGQGEYVVFLTADHGAVDVPRQLKDRGLPGGYFNGHDAYEALKKFMNKQHGEGGWIEGFRNQEVYLNHDLIDRKNLSREKIENEVARFLRRFQGVASTVTAADMKRQGYPSDSIDRIIQNGFYAPRSGDVYFRLKPGWLDSSSKKGTSHGSPYSYDTHVPLLFYGSNIPHGRTTRKTVIPQIAPTISAMLNITFPSGSASKPLRFE